MNKMDLLKQNMAKRGEKTKDALSDNMIRSRTASVPLSQIILNPNNIAADEDSVEDIERLAEDIATVGLLHNIVVHESGDGKYMIISGERRFKALQSLGWTHAPCVIYDKLPDGMFRVMTVLANLEAREYTPAKRLMLCQELEDQLIELKRQGIYRGAIGKGLSKIMGVSEQQISKYRRIISELTPEELSTVTNIDNTFKELKERKNESHFNFSADEEAAKNESDFNFSEPKEANASEVPGIPEHVFSAIDKIIEGKNKKGSPASEKEKNESHFNFSADEKVSKNESDFNFLTDEDPEQIALDIPEETLPKATTYPITATELNINYGGLSYLCAFGSHINGGWIAILNFGVSAELSNDRYDIGDNAENIADALLRSGDIMLPTGAQLKEAARHIAEIVTEHIGGVMIK